MSFESFCTLLGQTIAYFQLVENDVKIIYSAMLKGDMKQTLSKIEQEKWTMGQTIMELRDLDMSDDSPYIGLEDYNFLRQITEKRNHWCHQTVLTFVDIPNFSYSKEFINEYKKLEEDNRKLLVVSRNLEKIKQRALRDFNRL